MQLLKVQTRVRVQITSTHDYLYTLETLNTLTRLAMDSKKLPQVRSDMDIDHPEVMRTITLEN